MPKKTPKISSSSPSLDGILDFSISEQQWSYLEKGYALLSENARKELSEIIFLYAWRAVFEQSAASKSEVISKLQKIRQALLNTEKSFQKVRRKMKDGNEDYGFKTYIFDFIAKSLPPRYRSENQLVRDTEKRIILTIWEIRNGVEVALAKIENQTSVMQAGAISNFLHDLRSL